MSLQRHNPWVSVADLFSSFAVVVLFFLVAVVTAQQRAQQIHARDTAVTDAAGTDAGGPPGEIDHERKHREFMDQLNRDLRDHLDVVEVDVEHRVVTFKSESFEEREACVSRSARESIEQIAPQLCDLLFSDRDLEIHIEGHADPRAFRTVIRSSNRCGAFSNNTELSSARAAQVRELIAQQCRLRCPGPGALPSNEISFCDGMEQRAGAGVAAIHHRELRAELCARLPVTGYGGSRPKDPDDAGAPINRRVELHFLWGQPLSGRRVECTAAAGEATAPQPPLNTR
jgi:flagellar motor protein MotB